MKCCVKKMPFISCVFFLCCSSISQGSTNGFIACQAAGILGHGVALGLRAMLSNHQNNLVSKDSMKNMLVGLHCVSGGLNFFGFLLAKGQNKSKQTLSEVKNMNKQAEGLKKGSKHKRGKRQILLTDLEKTLLLISSC